MTLPGAPAGGGANGERPMYGTSTAIATGAIASSSIITSDAAATNTASLLLNNTSSLLLPYQGAEAALDPGPVAYSKHSSTSPLCAVAMQLIARAELSLTAVARLKSAANASLLLTAVARLPSS